MSWLSRLFGAGSGKTNQLDAEPPAPTLDEMNRLIPAFGRLMEKNATFATTVYDEAILPAPKARLELVLICAIGLTEDDRLVENIACALLHLSDYQASVGPVPAKLLPDFPATPELASLDAARAAAEAFAAHKKTSRYPEFEARVQHDLLRLKSLVDRALAVRAARLKEKRAQ